MRELGRKPQQKCECIICAGKNCRSCSRTPSLKNNQTTNAWKVPTKMARGRQMRATTTGGVELGTSHSINTATADSSTKQTTGRRHFRRHNTQLRKSSPTIPK